MKLLFAFSITIALLILPSVFAHTLVINSPLNNLPYGTRSVPFNLSSSDLSTFHYSDINNSARWIQICGNPTFNCIKNIRLREGLNMLMIKATNLSGHVNLKNIKVTIDSKKPKILETSPRRDSFINSSSIFSVNYTEENLDKINLYYGTTKDVKVETNNSNCTSGKNKNCDFTAEELSKFGGSGRFIEFWFEVLDKSNNAVNSSKSRIKVDTSPPELIFINTRIDDRKVTFIFDVIEENFEEITYTDSNDCGLLPKPSRALCRRLDNGRCVVTRRFCTGSHNLNITISDKAGNKLINNTEAFTII